jgi:hypothetical protein
MADAGGARVREDARPDPSTVDDLQCSYEQPAARAG